jgi:hypothetical protein
MCITGGGRNSDGTSCRPSPPCGQRAIIAEPGRGLRSLGPIRVGTSPSNSCHAADLVGPAAIDEQDAQPRAFEQIKGGDESGEPTPMTTTFVVSLSAMRHRIERDARARRRG